MSPESSTGPSRRLVGAGLVVLAILTLASLYHRSCFIDDAWLGERAFWLAREGVARSELFRGQLDYGERMFVFHKLFALCGAAAVRLFGWSLYVLKSVSLAWFLVFLLLLWRYCRRFAAPGVLPLTGLLLLGHGLLGLHLFIYRPEVMLMTLGFGSFLLLRRFLEGGGLLHVLGAATLAGLGVLTHLNGVVFIPAGALLLLVHRRPRAVVLFVFVSAAVGALYLADAAVAGELPSLFRQLRGDPILAERFGDVGGRVSSALGEHQRYFHSRSEILFSVLLLATVALTARATRLWTDPLLPFVLGLLVPLAVVAPDTQAYYALPALPYLALIVATGIVRGLPQQARLAHVLVGLLLAAHCLSGAFELGQIIASNEDTASRNRSLAARIGHPGTTVLATLPFVFNEIETYRIRGLSYYWVQNGFGRDPIPPEVLFADARAHGARFAVLSREDLKFSGWPGATLPPSGPNHRQLYRDDAHLILELF
jgi:hypothetical protein